MANWGLQVNTNDEYYTPKHVWEAIAQYIPRDKVIWEPFYGDGKSGEFLTELGFNVIHRPIDFFTHNEGEILVSNPPFSIRCRIIPRLIALDKPFIMLMPVGTITTQYLANAIGDEKLQIIIPRRRIQFFKLEEEKVITTNRCSFDCAYFCYKMNLPKDIIWLR
jgi:hypothetical protein